MHEKLDRPYSKCGYCGKERNQWKTPGCSVVLIQIVPGMHVVIFIRIVEKDNVCY